MNIANSNNNISILSGLFRIYDYLNNSRNKTILRNKKYIFINLLLIFKILILELLVVLKTYELYIYKNKNI